MGRHGMVPYQALPLLFVWMENIRAWKERESLGTRLFIMYMIVLGPLQKFRNYPDDVTWLLNDVEYLDVKFSPYSCGVMWSPDIVGQGL